jgi:hypothetical protein
MVETEGQAVHGEREQRDGLALEQFTFERTNPLVQERYRSLNDLITSYRPYLPTHHHNNHISA